MSALLPDAELTMEVSVEQVASWFGLPADERPCLLDCREAAELDICRIEGSEWLPLGEVPQSFERLKTLAQRGIVVYCHHGMRSMHATAFMRARGIDQSFSMAGGIEEWARCIDRAMERY
ncbi:MAG TPA: rhodanese-like domain-containing protein [Luteolibacter sp.]|nr:rhodanese-like domain-containing protein [Luteolibacter sp.]